MAVSKSGDKAPAASVANRGNGSPAHAECVEFSLRARLFRPGITGREGSDMQHVLLTRFNVQLRFHALGGEQWTDARLDLFEQKLLSSVLGQTTRDFAWLVFFDESTTPAQRERITGLSDDGRVFTPVYLSEVFDVSHVRAELKRRWPDAEHFLTTRVDNDDALARTFMATIRKAAEDERDQVPVFLNPTYGVQFDGRLLYRRPWPWNAFISLLETGAEPLSIFVAQHYSLSPYGRCLEIGGGEPLWLQYIHGGNLANRVNGLPMRNVDRVREQFTLDLAASPAGPQDVLAAVGRIGYRVVRNPGKLRGPARVLASKARRVARKVRPN